MSSLTTIMTPISSAHAIGEVVSIVLWVNVKVLWIIIYSGSLFYYYFVHSCNLVTVSEEQEYETTFAPVIICRHSVWRV